MKGQRILDRHCKGPSRLPNLKSVRRTSSLGTRAISEEINWRFPPFVVPGVALTRAVFSRGFGLVRLGGILFIEEDALMLMIDSDQSAVDKPTLEILEKLN